MPSAESATKPTGDQQLPEHLAFGRVVRPHGIRGGLVVEAYSDLIHSLTPGTTVYLGPSHSPQVVRSLREHRKRFLLFLEGCEDRSTAEQWRGQEVSIRFEAAAPLPEGVFYHWQILGLEVTTEEGESLGKVVDILETGANDVYVVRDETGREVLLPAIPSVVLEVDLQAECITVHLLPGLGPQAGA